MVAHGHNLLTWIELFRGILNNTKVAKIGK